MVVGVVLRCCARHAARFKSGTREEGVERRRRVQSVSVSAQIRRGLIVLSRMRGVPSTMPTGTIPRGRFVVGGTGNARVFWPSVIIVIALL